MDKTFTKGLFYLLLLPLLIITAAASAQTITVGAIDPGPYGRGSSITLPFHIDNTSGCIATNNTFKLVLSDANGIFPATPTVLTTKTGFYETFLNGTIPLTIPAGTGYRLRIESTSPAKISLPSNTFTISIAGGVIAGVSSQTISNSNPDIFGVCAADISNQSPYDFANTSTAGANVTAIFINEFSQTASAPKPIPTTFNADLTNYTIIVRAEAGSIIGTKSYTLINNTLYNAFGGATSTTVCLGSGTPLIYTLPLGDDATGEQKSFKYNYPGLVYNIKWGDNTSDNFTFCEINAAQGKLSHVYTQSSCGNVVGTQRNVFQVDFWATNKYCGDQGTPYTGYARVLTQPTNAFSYPSYACTNTAVTFGNISDPGQDPNSTGLDCKNADALYRWTVKAPDGTIFTSPSLRKEQNFLYTFPANGNYTVTLKLLTSNGLLCNAADVSHDICIQNKAKPDFDIPPLRCLSDGPLTPVDKSILDNSTCNTTLPTYNWKLVNGPANGVTFNATATLPQFNFNKIGVYQFQLEITSSSCGPQLSPIKTIVVNSTPIATLSSDAPLCGKGVTLSFDPTAGPTKTTFDGTAQPLATTYTWAVTSPDGGTFSFAPGSNANTQYPRIVFNDYATYNVSVTHTNNCGTITKTEKLTFSQSPTVSAGPPQPFICEDSQVTLAGTPGVGGLVTAVRWTSPTANAAAFSAPNAPNTIYTPTAADIANGQVLLTYTATTSLGAPCNSIASTVLITIIKKATVTSANNPSICSGGNFNYTITAANQATTFTWTATVTSGTATGFSATGSGNTINDLITNNSNTDAVITYTILPRLNGCDGTPFLLRLTVHLLPVITATPVDLEICSNQPANITLTSNVTPTTYTWTSVASAGITGNTNRATAATATSIQDILVNTAATQGTVTYTITPYNGTCPGTPKQAVVIVKPAPKQSVAGPDEAICISNTYTLQGNDPAPGTGKWTVTSAQAGITFSNDADPHAIVSGLQPGQVYKFTWTITAAPTCPPTQSTVTITNNAEAAGGTTTGIATVCAPTNNGTVTLSGYTGTIIRWESSVNGGASWLPVVNTTATLNYNNLTQTTQYRAVVSGGACGNEFSTVTTITVNQPAIIANAGPDNPQCNVTTVNLQGNNPGAFVGEWTQITGPVATIVTPADPFSQVTGLVPGNSYTFRWTIKGVLPCGDSFDDVVIIDKPDMIASFTPGQTQACGPTEITFTNTSAPTFPGTVYEWNFGDGSPVSSIPKHTFLPGADGKDINYTVSLTIVGNCVVRQPVTATITVSPAKPDARINPSEVRSCGVLNLSVDNLSPGTNDTYTFYLIDENNNQVTAPITKTNNDKSTAMFPAINPTHIATWRLYMEAKDKCGNINRSPEFQIPVSPSNIVSNMQIKDNPAYVCLGSPVFFRNLSAGGDVFKYIIYDENKNPITNFPGSLDELSYTFPTVGSYYVSITASNSGCGDAPPSTLIPIQVTPLPQPQFTYTVDVDNKVKFTNITPAAGSTPAASLTYVWNFGDGTAPETSFTPNDHSYDYTKSPYTVTLTARNPGTSCEGIVTHTIEIKFTGELFLPNAFQPAATETELRTFKAKGQKLKEWRMQVFNNWGQLVWQTTALNSNGEPTEGWDGTFKGVPAQQGVYIWQVTARFLNGSDWKGMSYKGSLPKRSGTINLIR